MSVRPIILAEDNDKLRRMYSDMLEAAGFTVMGVADGEKAIGLLHKVVNPQLIILTAAIADVPGLKEAFAAGQDIHAMTASQVFGVPLAEMTPETRRRAKAIKELEAMAAEDSQPGAAVDEISDEQAAVNQLAQFITRNDDTFEDGDQMIYRFGYVVGLVNACIRQDGSNEGRFNRFLRNLVFKTGFVDRKEIDALLDNYERIVNQSQFQQGWLRGRDDAPNVGLPPVDRFAARFEEQAG